MLLKQVKPEMDDFEVKEKAAPFAPPPEYAPLYYWLSISEHFSNNMYKYLREKNWSFLFCPLKDFCTASFTWYSWIWAQTAAEWAEGLSGVLPMDHLPVPQNFPLPPSLRLLPVFLVLSVSPKSILRTTYECVYVYVFLKLFNSVCICTFAHYFLLL